MLVSSFQNNDSVNSSSSPPTSSQHFTNATFSDGLAPSTSIQKSSRPLSSSSTTITPVYVTSDVPIDNIEFYMPNSYEFPSSQQSSYSFGAADTNDNLLMWSVVGGGNNADVANNSMGSNFQAQNHNRHPSTSSIGSTASVASRSYQVQQAQRGLRGSVQATRKSSNVSHSGQQVHQSTARGHLLTPTPTPTRNTFSAQQATSYNLQHQNLDPTTRASLLMNSVLLDQKYNSDDEVSQMAHSSGPSYASMGQAPATPNSTVGDRQDDGQQMMNNGETYPSNLPSWMSQDLPLSKTDSMAGTIIPKFNRTVTDAYQDNLFFAQPAVSQQQTNPSYLMAANTMVNDRLLEAQMARSQSSGSNHSAQTSPYRYGHADVEQQDVKYQLSPRESSPKTISPKDAVLNYRASNTDFPLFPQSTADLSSSYVAVSPNHRREQQYVVASTMDFNSNGQVWAPSMSTYNNAPLQTFNNFVTPALPNISTNLNMANISGYMGQNMPQASRNSRRQTESTPEFNPAQLTRMESSASEAPQSSQASSAQVVTSPKPDTSADTGTYSCTYSGCLQRFTTPQKLQKHKRDTHRNSPHVTPGVGSGMSTAQLMERNSQTGPHICGRSNPTTGKPCDAVFSRPYDLTRHEDTIHNIRKQKVRCAICVEDKTFSRSDALTRHMRVVHPEVDFPGKHRKRGSRDE